MEIPFPPSQYKDPKAPYSDSLKPHPSLPIKMNLKGSPTAFITYPLNLC